MKIYADADALPNAIKDILFRAAERLALPLVLVADKYIKGPPSPHISSVAVPGGLNAADDRIVELVREGDLVITADIPLADRVVTKGAYALDPRGELYTEENVKQRLAMRDLLNELRSGGEITGGPPAFGRKDRQAFANALNGFLTKRVQNQAR